MPPVDKEIVEFGAKVSREDYEEFKESFPQYGAVNWFINMSLREFNQQVRENPSAKDMANKAIQRMLEDNRANSSAAPNI